MEGILRIFIGLIVFATMDLAYATPQEVLSSLEKKRDLVMNALERVKNGQDPCFRRDCQNEKRAILRSLHRQLQRLPGDLTKSLPSKDRGLRSAKELVRRNFAKDDPSFGFPQTVEDWSKWWMKRYSNEERIRSRWTALSWEISSQELSLRIYEKFLEAEPAKRRILSELWAVGLPEVIEKFREAGELTERAAQSEREDLQKRAQAALEEALKLQENLNAPVRLILAELMPAYSFSELKNFVYDLHQWMERTFSDDPFDPYLVEFLPFILKQYKEISRLKNQFEAMEYGQLGLSNFWSSTNPALQIENEIMIQDFLDRVDGSGRLLASLATYRLSMDVGQVITKSSFLSNFVIPGLIAYYFLETGTPPINHLWPPSARTQELHQKLPQIRDRMETKRRTLLMAHRKLLAGLDQIDRQISLIEMQLEEPPND